MKISSPNMPPSPNKARSVPKTSGKFFRSKERPSGNSLNGSSGGYGESSDGGNLGLSGGYPRRDDLIDIKDCPLAFPDASPLDHLASLLRYSSLVASHGIPLEDLDGLQLELELLMSSIRVRQMSFQSQIAIVDQLEKGKFVPRMGVSAGKRLRKEEADRPSKKAKDLNAKPRDPSVVGPPPSKSQRVRVNVVKNEPVFDVPDIGVVEQTKPVHPKNDICNRFWSMIDLYCQEITPDDIKMVQELQSVYQEDNDCYKIPPLGKHYTLRWAQEDLQEEQKESMNIDVKRRGMLGDIPDKLLKEVNMNGCDDIAPFGPLTQRVIAGLVEENVLESKNIENKGMGLARPGFMKSLALGTPAGINNPSGLEKRIKKELQEQGILDEFGNENDDDEILMELKKCQAELRAISAHNHSQLNRLLRLASDALYRHDLKKKLKDAEAKVIEAYKIIAAARQKKKVPLKKDKDFACKALKEREELIRQLDLNMNNNT